MFISNLKLFVLIIGMAAFVPSTTFGQKKNTTPKPAATPIIFAVLNDGERIEPIAYISGGKLSEPVNGSDERSLVTAFNNTYYGPKAIYRLIFGGANAGTVAVLESFADADCAPNTAKVSVTSTNTKLKGMLMGLATNAPAKLKGSGVRRSPTWPERNEIDALVRAEFGKNSVPVTKLDYHNLTALDVNGDKKAELVGSFWVENLPKERVLLFFIAEKGADGKYALTHTDLRVIKEDEVMSGEIAALDSGIYHELLLDVFDYDGDGQSEIFTYVQAFEGAGFNVYKKNAGKWEKVFEGSNYHCGF
ncbi:hypothetical protein BH24ACI3_BH24ACI3_09600 [soil metagenome]